jgi:MarR family 2-MHQ and catechol resistance regulon transcriptional repressor
MSKTASFRALPYADDAGNLDRTASLRLFVMMARAMRAVTSLLREHLKQWDLSPAEFGVLEALLHKGPIPLSMLADTLLTSAPGMTYTVKGLEKRELLRRRSSSDDQRVVVAELTAPGRRLIEKVFPEHVAAMQRAMRGLTRAEKRQAAALLKTLGRGARAGRPRISDRTTSNNR